MTDGQGQGDPGYGGNQGQGQGYGEEGYVSFLYEAYGDKALTQYIISSGYIYPTREDARDAGIAWVKDNRGENKNYLYVVVKANKTGFGDASVYEVAPPYQDTADPGLNGDYEAGGKLHWYGWRITRKPDGTEVRNTTPDASAGAKPTVEWIQAVWPAADSKGYYDETAGGVWVVAGNDVKDLYGDYAKDGKLHWYGWIKAFNPVYDGTTVRLDAAGQPVGEFVTYTTERPTYDTLKDEYVLTGDGLTGYYDETAGGKWIGVKKPDDDTAPPGGGGGGLFGAAVLVGASIIIVVVLGSVWKFFIAKKDLIPALP
jgi:hypothetical protein